jgi:hypothetical protein
MGTDSNTKQNRFYSFSAQHLQGWKIRGPPDTEKEWPYEEQKTGKNHLSTNTTK